MAIAFHSSFGIRHSEFGRRMFSWFRNSRRKKLLAEPFPAPWLEILAKNVGHYALLPAELQRRLRETTRILVAERTFVGAGGLEVTDEMKVTVAAQAALLLLGGHDYYFDRMTEIFLYPRRVKAALTNYQHRLHGGSAFVDEDAMNLGEAWHDRRVRLSWPDALRGGRDPHDGINLVLHEFAHHLDGLDGDMGGLPPQETRAKQERWEAVIDQEYSRHLAAVEAGRDTLLDPYGAENEAEFFAISTECFYEQPRELKQAHPELHEILRDFYKVDPSEWQASPR
jgi:Mlc titration factor MtfA (ptsG expression regulator)